MSTCRRRLSISLIVPVFFIALLVASADADARIAGVWACDAARPGSTTARPLTLVFHADGTLTYSEQTTVNGGPLSLPFTSRGGGYGTWSKLGHHGYAYQARENLYINGNAGGFFYVDSTQHLDRQTGELCSGRPECPGTATKIRVTQFTFGVDGHITGEVDLLPAGSQLQTACVPLSTAFPGLP